MRPNGYRACPQPCVRCKSPTFALLLSVILGHIGDSLALRTISHPLLSGHQYAHTRVITGNLGYHCCRLYWFGSNLLQSRCLGNRPLISGLYWPILSRHCELHIILTYHELGVDIDHESPVPLRIPVMCVMMRR